MQTARTEPAEPAEHAETARRWVHSMIDGSAGLPASQVGGKAWNLARLADAGALVPPWVVIPALGLRPLRSSRRVVSGWCRRLRFGAPDPPGDSPPRPSHHRRSSRPGHCWSARGGRRPLIGRGRGQGKSVLRGPVRLYAGRTPDR